MSFRLPDSTNVVADVLSRAVTDKNQICYALSAPHVSFLNDLKKELASDPKFVSMITKLQSDNALLPGYKLKDGLLLYANCRTRGPSEDYGASVRQFLLGSNEAGGPVFH